MTNFVIYQKIKKIKGAFIEPSTNCQFKNSVTNPKFTLYAYLHTSTNLLLNR